MTSDVRIRLWCHRKIPPIKGGRGLPPTNRIRTRRTVKKIPMVMSIEERNKIKGKIIVSHP